MGRRLVGAILVLLGMSMAAHAGPPPGEYRFIGSDQHAICLATPAHRVIRLTRHGQGLAGVRVPSCTPSLTAGPAPGLRLFLRSERGSAALKVGPAGHRVWNTLTPDARRMKHDKTYRRLITILRRGKKRSLALKRRARWVEVVRLKPGPIQFLRVWVHHHPQTRSTALRTFAFLGHGMTLGPAQWALAILEPRAKTPRRVFSRFVRSHCLGNRCRTRGNVPGRNP